MANFTSAHTGDEIDLAVASGSTTTGVIKDFTTLSGSATSTVTVGGNITSKATITGEQITSTDDMEAIGTITAEHFQSSDDIVAVGEIHGNVISSSGDMHIGGSITTSGEQLEVAGSLIVTGSISSSGNIHTLNNLLVGGASSSVDGLTVEGSISASGNVHIFGVLTALTAVRVGDSFRMVPEGDNIKLVESGLFVDSHITASGNLTVAGDISSSGIFNLQESASIGVTTTGAGAGTIIPNKGLFVSGSISGSSTSTGSFGRINVADDISASGTILASVYKIDELDAITTSGTELLFGSANYWTQLTYGRQDADAHKFNGHITASGNISSSKVMVGGASGSVDGITVEGDISSSGDVYVIGNISSSKVMVGGASGSVDGITVEGDISSSGTISGNKLRLDDGTEALPSIAFLTGGQEDNGIFRRSNNTLGISAGGDGMMTIAPEGVTIGSGHVGNDLNPGANGLLVEGNITASANISSSGDVIANNVFIDDSQYLKWQSGNTFLREHNDILYVVGEDGINLTGAIGASGITIDGGYGGVSGSTTISYSEISMSAGPSGSGGIISASKLHGTDGATFNDSLDVTSINNSAQITLKATNNLHRNTQINFKRADKINYLIGGNSSLNGGVFVIASGSQGASAAGVCDNPIMQVSGSELGNMVTVTGDISASGKFYGNNNLSTFIGDISASGDVYVIGTGSFGRVETEDGSMFGNRMIVSVQTIAAAGSNVGSATEFDADGGSTVFVTDADNAKGVRVPQIAVGSLIKGTQFTIYNLVTNKTLKVYPSIGDRIFPAVDGTAVELAASCVLVLTCDGTDGFRGYEPAVIVSD